jgi:hypothetical protein
MTGLGDDKKDVDSTFFCRRSLWLPGFFCVRLFYSDFKKRLQCSLVIATVAEA